MNQGFDWRLQQQGTLIQPGSGPGYFRSSLFGGAIPSPNAARMPNLPVVTPRVPNNPAAFDTPAYVPQAKVFEAPIFSGYGNDCDVVTQSRMFQSPEVSKVVAKKLELEKIQSSGGFGWDRLMGWACESAVGGVPNWVLIAGGIAVLAYMGKGR